MGFVGDWIVFSFKILFSAVLGGVTGWQSFADQRSFDVRVYALLSSMITMLVAVAIADSGDAATGSVGFVVAGVFIAVAIIASQLTVEGGDSKSSFESTIKLMYTAVVGILVGGGKFVEAVIAVVFVYLISRYFDTDTKSEV